jgi:PDZ domain-containing protein
MSRRALAFLVGLVVLIGLFAATALVSLPYVVLYPGPTLNLLGTSGGRPVVEVGGHQTYPDAGRLDLVTYYAYDHPNLITTLGEWLSPGHSVVSEGEFLAGGLGAMPETGPDALPASEIQNELTAAVLRQLEIPFGEKVIVSHTVPGFPAAGVLRAGDAITAIDGRPVTSLTGTGQLIEDRAVGQPISVTVNRRGVAKSFRLLTKRGTDGKAEIGIYESGAFTFPFSVRVGANACSGGCDLMFALALLDKLSPLNLTGGGVVAGTGDVDDLGDIEPVFGINVLLADLHNPGATVFLTPAADCAQALRAAPHGLRLVKVSTLDGAVSALEAVRAGRPAPLCAG